jgi:hypothetical protein
MTRRAIIFISLLAIGMVHPASSQEHMKYSVLGIEYVGESDKPITPIVISDSKAGAEWYRAAVLKRSELELTYEHVVSSSLLKELIGDADSYKGTVQREREKNSQFSKPVSVTIITPQRRVTFSYDRESAISLLDSLQMRCKDDGSLRSDLSHFQDRIRP